MRARPYLPPRGADDPSMRVVGWHRRSLITNDECEKLQRSLNSSFAKLKLPDYVAKISVSGVSLVSSAALRK
jgi:hypothetical protein